MEILKNTFSGVAGETSVAGRLLRFGVKISKPYWNDDEVDFEIKIGDGDSSINIPLQVKNVQFAENNDKAFIQGLKKKYVERNQVLCLAIYNTQTNWLWFIAGNNQIKEAYEKQSNWNKRHKNYSDLKNEDDVRIAVPKNGKEILAKYKIRNDDNDKFKKILDKIANRKTVTIIPEEENEEVNLSTNLKVKIKIQEKENIQASPTEFLIDGSISNIISAVYDIFIKFCKDSNIDNDLSILFRELFINSIAHRSYRIETPNNIIFSKEKIEISNPGGLVKELSIDSLFKNPITALRNPKLTYELVSSKLMESRGSGLYRAKHIETTIPKWELNLSIKNEEFTAEIKKNNVA